MNEQTVTLYEKRLRNKRDDLLSQISQQRDGMLGRVDAAEAHFSHPEDSHAQLISEKDIEFAVDEREAAELNAVEAALKRIASGRYGYCIDCGELITSARLEATPEAVRCLRCQEISERLLLAS